MHHRSHTMRLVCLTGLAAVAAIDGCSKSNKPVGQKVAVKPIYVTLPPKQVPAVFKDSILERCDLLNTDPFMVSGYGVVVNLDSTGGPEAPNLVRQYIVDQMFKHGVGSSMSDIKTPSPEAMLRDPRVAIVQVDGYLPPGVRKGQRFDVQVLAIPESSTTSLAGGDLLQTELRIMGANPNDPGGAVNVFARGEGPVFVNPAYALDPKAAQNPAARGSLRFGIAMNGAGSLEDRPIGLRLRSPSMRMSRFIESRIDSRFQELKPDIIAAAQDEGVVNFFVPPSYNGDWDRFASVVTHLYLDGSPEFVTRKAEALADEAVKPDAPLNDISFAWEGLGKGALPIILKRNLMTHADHDVSYAATRAAAMLEEPSALQSLVNIARTTGHKFQINAIQTLGALRNSPAVNEALRPLLESDQRLVRLEAYRMLSRNGDPTVTQVALPAGFGLDIIRSTASPVVYATRRGEPRIAVIGNKAQLQLPIVFSAMDGRLTISSDQMNRNVTIFYRPAEPPGGVHTSKAARMLEPIKVISSPDIAEIIARLGGQGYEGGRTLNFNYGQIVSILSNLTSQGQIVAVAGQSRVPASFMLQQLPEAQDTIYSAPVISDQGRPLADEPGRVGLAK